MLRQVGDVKGKRIFLIKGLGIRRTPNKETQSLMSRSESSGSFHNGEPSPTLERNRTYEIEFPGKTNQEMPNTATLDLRIDSNSQRIQTLTAYSSGL